MNEDLLCEIVIRIELEPPAAGTERLVSGKESSVQSERIEQTDFPQRCE